MPRNLSQGRLNLACLALIMMLGVVMTGCAPNSTGNNNPAEQADGPIGASPELKEAATQAFDLNRNILTQIDPALFTGDYALLTSERQSSETPAMANGYSYWDLTTTSDLKDTDVHALFDKLRTYLESDGWKVSSDDRRVSSTGGVSGGADFRKDGPVVYLSMGVTRGPAGARIYVEIATRHFSNPPMSEWPAAGADETWQPNTPLWPEGLGPTPSPSPSGTAAP
jgi:hypothetical protein